MSYSDKLGGFTYHINVMIDDSGNECWSDTGELHEQPEYAWLEAAKYVARYGWEYIATAIASIQTREPVSNADGIERMADIIRKADAYGIEPNVDTWERWLALEDEVNSLPGERCHKDYPSFHEARGA